MLISRGYLQGNSVDARWGSGLSQDPEAPLDPNSIPNTHSGPPYLQNQDDCPPQTRTFDTFRRHVTRAVNLIRTTLLFRRPPRPPDWEYDTAAGDKKEDSGIVGWRKYLVVDTSLPAHYKVNITDIFIIITQQLLIFQYFNHGKYRNEYLFRLRKMDL